MAATGAFADAITAITAEVTGAGFRAVTDPRNLAPRSVFVQLPRFESFNNNIADITVQLQVVAAPPGNTDATDWLLTTVDTLLQTDLAIVAGEPITLLIGDMELPAYQLTTRLATRRN